MPKIKITLFLTIPLLIILFSFFFLKSEKKEIVSDLLTISEEKTFLPEEKADLNDNNKEESEAPDSKGNPKNQNVEEKNVDLESSKEVNGDAKITQHFVSWGYSSSKNRNIDTIIIHSSYNALGGDYYNLDKLIEEYKSYGVSPHYLIDRKGNIHQLVNDKNIAYHAGESKMSDGRTDVNNFSLGIELMNTESDKITESQYRALNSLISILKSRYKIINILGHNQIAPGRKTDPWNISWSKVSK